MGTIYLCPKRQIIYQNIYQQLKSKKSVIFKKEHELSQFLNNKLKEIGIETGGDNLKLDITYIKKIISISVDGIWTNNYCFCGSVQFNILKKP